MGAITRSSLENLGSTPTAFIHAGTHKTASTSLQQYFFDNREAFLEHSVLYPHDEGKKARRLIKHYHLSLALGDGQSREAGVLYSKLAKQIRNARPRHVILSCEFFAPRLGFESLEFLRRYFADLGFDLKIVAYLRDQPAYINSRYNQDVKRLRTGQTFDRYASYAPGKTAFDYKRLFESPLQHPSVDFIARPFDKAIRRGIDVDFLTLVFPHGAPLLPCPLTRENESTGPLTLLAARVAYALARRAYPEERLFLYAAKVLIDATTRLGWNDEKFEGLDEGSSVRLVDAFRERNDKLALELWGTDWESQCHRKIPTRNVREFRSTTLEERRELDEVIALVLSSIDERMGSDDAFKIARDWGNSGSRFGKMLARIRW